MRAADGAAGMAETSGAPRLTHRGVLSLSLPIILSNIATPLLGVTNTAVIGRLGEAHLIGAVAIGAAVFTFLFWGFGFLRMGTTGLTAQAAGAHDRVEIATILARALLIAAVAGLALILLRQPLAWASLALMKPSAAVEEGARAYVVIRIWSAPFTLANYALLGWFIGLGHMRTTLLLQLVLNGANIILNVALVNGFGWGVQGVALGTLIAEILAAALGLWIAFRHSGLVAAGLNWRRVLDRPALARMLALNGDLMLRTLALQVAFTFFTAQAARADDVILAANEVLLQFLSMSAYLLDGFAFATEALTGRAIGAAHREGFREAVRLSSLWACGIALAASLAFFAAGGTIIDAITTNAAVREAARLYLPWAALAPIAGVACFQLDGIFIGATRTRAMRDMMAISLAIFFLAWAALTPAFGNHGLWASLIVFFAARGLTLLTRFPALARDAFPAAGM